jgi:regulator of nucleoside diphosphate kinase
MLIALPDTVVGADVTPPGTRRRERIKVMLLSERIISTRDNERLTAALDRARGSWLTYAPYLDFFRAQLRRAQVAPPSEVPEDVITMNSRFALADRRTGESICYTLVYPEDEARRQGKLSVLTPMGIALFGARVGDDVCWTSNDGPEVATVQRLLYQPEKAGDHHL